MKKLSILFLSILLILGFSIGIHAWAEEDMGTGEVEEIGEITIDEDITAEDLGVAEPKILPDNPFYFVKNFWRKVRTKLTFNPIKKAELQFKIANERLIEAKKLANKTANEKILQKAMDKYQEEMGIVKNRIEAFKEKAVDNPRIDKFLDNFTDKTFKQQKLMDRLEKQLSDKPELLEKIRSNKERALEHFGEIINKLEEKDKIQERIEKNLEKTEGSKFKNFKNLEVLIRLEEKIPEQAREAIKQAQENALQRLHENLEQMSQEDQARFGDYLDKIGGDQGVQLKVLEGLKAKNPTPILRQKIEQNRIQVQERAENIKQDTIQLQQRIKERAKEQTQEQPQEQNREQIREQACVTVWDPVCGDDGKTYSNTCFAKSAGAEVSHKGRCETTRTKKGM